MVRYLSILTLSLFAASTARAVPLRVLMENVSATNSALFVSTRAPYGITVPQIVVSSGVTAATGTFSGAVSAGSFSGPLTGNVTGNVTGNATTATTATNIAGGAAGQIPYQTGAGATSFVGPGISSSCASGFHLSTTTVVNGIITGGGCISDNNFPNTGNTTYSLTASSGASFGSDVHVTGTLEATKLKGDGSQLTGVGGGGTVQQQGNPQAGQIAVFANSGGTLISTGPVAAAAWNGVNYMLWSASAPGVAYSTGAGGFHIAAATYVFRGLAYAVPDTNFSIGASTNAMVWWNPANFGNGNNGYTLYGLVDTSMATLSTFVVTGLVSDDIAVLLTTTTANSVPRFMDTVQHSPLPSVKVFEGGRFMPNQNSGETIFSDGYNCAATKIVFMSCIYNTAAEQPFLGPQYVYHDFFNSGGAAMFSFTVYNSSAGAANISAASVEVSRNNYRVNAGAAGVITVDSPAPTLISVAAGKYSTVSISTNYGGSASISVTLVINLPPGVTIVRSGYW